MSEPVFHLAPVPESSEPGEAGGEGPGGRLRAAREKLGLTVEQICGELKLAPEQVEDLENDRYEGIPGETYVRGYLRTYARVVKLPPEQILEEYRQVRAFGEGARPVMPVSESQVPLTGRPVRAVVTLVLVVVAGIAVGWWYTNGGGSVPVALTGKTATPVLPEPAVSPVAGQAPPATADTVAEPPAVTSRTERAELPEVHAGDGSITAALPPAAPSAADVASAPATQPAPADPAPAPAPAEAAVDAVSLDFEQTSWAEVQDATGQRLLYQTVEAGRQLELNGTAPFAVVLGNAAGVRVRFNGEPVSVAVEEPGTVSRFNLGEEATGAE